MPDPDCPKCKGLGGYPSCPECHNANPVSSSDTPRTDAHVSDGPGIPCVDADFARQLERELMETRQELIESRESALDAHAQIEELQTRLIERTAAYEKKDAEQVRRIAELELAYTAASGRAEAWMKCAERLMSAEPGDEFGEAVEEFGELERQELEIKNGEPQ